MPAATEDVDLPLQGFDVRDVDASSSGVLSLTISAEVGNVLVIVPGFNLTPATGFKSRAQINGTLDELRTALATLTYRSKENFNGMDAVRFEVVDNHGGAAEQSMPLLVQAVNDAPVVNIEGKNLTVAEDTVLDVIGVSVLDVDVSDTATLSIVEATVSANHGEVMLASTNNLVLELIAGDLLQGSKQLKFRGAVVQVNIALHVLQYIGFSDWHGRDTINITINDLGNHGLGGALSHSQTINVEVTPVNDAPIVTVPVVPLQVVEDGELVLTDIGVVDVDSKDGGRVMARDTSDGGFELWRSEGARPGYDADSTPTLLGDQEWGRGDVAWRHSLVRDIAPGSRGSSPRHFAVLGKLLYFQADDGSHGAELWRTDGSAEGTAIVKDLQPGTRSSSPRFLTQYKGKLYFQADGVDTTWMLQNPENHLGRHFHPSEVDSCNGFRQSGYEPSAFFAVSSSNVWDPQKVYDCPAGFHWASTAEAMDLFSGTHGTEASGSDQMTYWGQCGWKEFEWGGLVRKRFRFVDSSQTGAYKHAGRRDSYMPEIDHSTSEFAGIMCVRGDGACRGTAQLWGIGPEHTSAESEITDRDACFLRSGSELWESDGTEHGTKRVTDAIRPGLSGSSPTFLTVMNVGSGPLLFFGAVSDKYGNELWRTDGTEGGTVVVKDIHSGHVGSNPQFLTVFNNKLYFSANEDTYATEPRLWVSDGVARSDDVVAGRPGDNAAGTKQVDSSADAWSPKYLAACQSNLFFQASNGAAGPELWKTDGSTVTLVKDIQVGGAGSRPSYIVCYNNHVYFQADDGKHGAELWRSDGTDFGTAMVEDIQTGAYGSRPSFLTVFSPTEGKYADGTAQLFFLANVGVGGWQMWRSDGSDTKRAFHQTHNGVNLDSAAMDADYPAQLAVFENTMFYSANNAHSVQEDAFTAGIIIGTSSYSSIAQAVVVEDVDGQNQLLTVTVNCSKGLVSLHETTDLVFIEGTGFLDSSVTFQASLVSINHAFATLSYKPRRQESGSDEIGVYVYDTGVDDAFGPSHMVAKHIPLQITSDSSAPTLSVPSKVHAAIGVMTVIRDVQVTDIGRAQYLTVTLSCKYGTMRLNSLKGLHFLQGRGVRSRFMKFIGNYQHVSDSLGALQYICSAENSCSATADVLSMSLASNVGNAEEVTKTVSVTIG
jgi:ELWxxDGT repeat protein